LSKSIVVVSSETLKELQKSVFTREGNYCFQRVLAITILAFCPSVRLSVCHMGRSVKSGTS